MFLADLIRAIDLPLETHLMAISPYGGGEESMGRVRILLDVELDLGDRTSCSSRTSSTPVSLSYLCRSSGRATRRRWRCAPSSTARPAHRALRPRYVGFDCPDRFVIGYGLDFEERYRNVADILEVSDTAALKADLDALLPHLAVAG